MTPLVTKKLFHKRFKGAPSQTNLKSIKGISEVQTLSAIKFTEIKPK